jgi:hypothetical protein
VLTDLPARSASFDSRVTLTILYLLGPLVRSVERERVRFAVASDAYDVAPMRFDSRGRIVFSNSEGDAAEKIDAAILLGEIRESLVKYGLAVAVTDGFQSWDLNIVLPPAVRVPLNALRMSDGTVALAWRTRTEATATIIAAIVIFILMIAAGFTWPVSVAVTLVIVALAMVPAIVRLMRVPSLIRAAAQSAARAHNLSVVVRPGEIF